MRGNVLDMARRLRGRDRGDKHRGRKHQSCAEHSDPPRCPEQADHSPLHDAASGHAHRLIGNSLPRHPLRLVASYLNAPPHARISWSRHSDRPRERCVGAIGGFGLGRSATLRLTGPKEGEEKVRLRLNRGRGDELGTRVGTQLGYTPGPELPIRAGTARSRREMVAAASCVRAVGDRDHGGVVGFEYLAQQSATHEAGVGRGIELH